MRLLKKTWANRALCAKRWRSPLLIVATLLMLLLPAVGSAQANRVKKVLFQGFWWNYWNSNFPNKWSNYLTELAPRLKAAGIDGVWVPPAYKNGSPGSVGYSPFDHYDLGDKYQKGGSDSLNVRTRMGNKDELLRLFMPCSMPMGWMPYRTWC
jgi:alpha-amylase